LLARSFFDAVDGMRLDARNDAAVHDAGSFIVVAVPIAGVAPRSCSNAL
jgi:hypothetical protein